MVHYEKENRQIVILLKGGEPETLECINRALIFVLRAATQEGIELITPNEIADVLLLLDALTLDGGQCRYGLEPKRIK